MTRGAPARVSYWVVFGVVTTMTLTWLVVGTLVSTPLNEPPGQAVVDYLASAVNLVVAVVLLRFGGASWPTRLLALAMVGSAGAFNLQAHAATLAVRDATGVEIGELHQVLLHGIAGAAYAGALLLVTGSSSRRLRVLAPVVAAVLFVAGFGTALLPHTVSCVVFFGFGVPLLGVAAVGPAVRRGPTPEERARARLLTSVLVAALGALVVLALLTLVLALLGRPGLTLDDPTARHGGVGAGLPLALLFWFSRITAPVIALAVLAARRARSAERGLHRGLAALLAVVALGGLAVLLSTLVGTLLGTVAGWAVAVVAVAVLWLPVTGGTDRLAERLLHGTRATPAAVLAQVSALAQGSARGETDLERVPEAVGRALGARSVRLTVHRDGMRDRVLSWAGDTGGDDEVAFGIRHTGTEVGSLAVDGETLVGSGDRHLLVAAVADGLGGVLAAHRQEIELERQLRAAVAHAERIATARRRLVAETDAERRELERNLHDGAQHHLVSLRLTLGLVEHLAGAGRLEDARDRLAQLAEQLDTAEAVLAETASGVSSATLARLGLVESLRADLADAAGVTVVAEGVGRYDEAVEAAAYFVCLEAVNNARKHAGGAAVRVRLTGSRGTLRLEVSDDGPGFVPSTDGAGRGLGNLTGRLARVGGHVTIASAPGEGTTVRGEIPVAGPSRPAPSRPDGPRLDASRPDASRPDGARPVPPDARPPRVVVPRAVVPEPEDTRRRAVVPVLGTGPRRPPDTIPAPLPPPGSALFEATQLLAWRALEEVPVGHRAAPRVQELAARLAAPWRIGVTGPTPADVAPVAAALSGLVEKPCAVVDLAVRAALGPLTPDEVPDVLVLLAEDDAGTRTPDWLAAVPTVGARVVPAVSVTADDPPTDVVRVALPGPGALGGRNLGRLAAVVVGRCRPRAARRRALTALAAGEELLAREPAQPWTRWLAVEVERVRAAGARELAEATLADDLAEGRIVLPAGRREAATRLLLGAGARARLGLEATAEESEVARAAREQRAVWHRLATHPAAGRAVREAAAVLAAACESLPDPEPSSR